jgi:hypothetical protein
MKVRYLFNMWENDTDSSFSMSAVLGKHLVD